MKTFAGWVHEIIRTQSRRAIGGGLTGRKRFDGDVAVDRAADLLREEWTPDRKQQPAHFEPEGDPMYGHIREETPAHG